jgi:hypothetical protein
MTFMHTSSCPTSTCMQDGGTKMQHAELTADTVDWRALTLVKARGSEALPFGGSWATYTPKKSTIVTEMGGCAKGRSRACQI